MSNETTPDIRIKTEYAIRYSNGGVEVISAQEHYRRAFDESGKNWFADCEVVIPSYNQAYAAEFVTIKREWQHWQPS